MRYDGPGWVVDREESEVAEQEAFFRRMERIASRIGTAAAFLRHSARAAFQT